jgi:hypothetical protein
MRMSRRLYGDKNINCANKYGNYKAYMFALHDDLHVSFFLIG